MICANANAEIAVKRAWLPFVIREVKAGESKRKPIIISGLEMSEIRFATRNELTQSRAKSTNRPIVQLWINQKSDS